MHHDHPQPHPIRHRADWVMKALSIRQPWAWLIVNGLKDIENRDWNERYPGTADARALIRSGDLFLIHAGKGMTKDEYEDALDTCHHVSRSKPFPPGTKLPAFSALERGGIIGQARLVAIGQASSSPWFFGPIGLLMKDAEPLPFRPMKGALGFFSVEDENA